MGERGEGGRGKAVSGGRFPGKIGK